MFLSTPTLAERSADLLVRHVERLRRAYADVQTRDDTDFERDADYIHWAEDAKELSGGCGE